jgi:Ca-activated chloride channel family protein
VAVREAQVRIQFNPSRVASYRLIGYENRIADESDSNSAAAQSAGEIHAGETVTALYEVVPAAQSAPSTRPASAEASTPAADGGELFTLVVRYKPVVGAGKPESPGTPSLLELPVRDSGNDLARASDDFRFTAAVAEFGMLLRDSPHKGKATYAGVLELARPGSRPDDKDRQEFLSLVAKARDLSGERSAR